MIPNKLFEKYGVKREEFWKLSSTERLEFRFRYKDIEEETKVDNSLFKDVMFLLAVGLVVLLFNIIGIVINPDLNIIFVGMVQIWKIIFIVVLSVDFMALMIETVICSKKYKQYTKILFEDYFTIKVLESKIKKAKK